ncbi:putative membrane protein YqjE [Planomicrobium stackebrandtii]|uniref:Membrane protein YqjE n=1 Tax=Planomicrobium stackebrandtii TaxID=253160 RepID=A0ABU0GPD2_9BACL|nr:hypothetical protein [Planomicrobium stackebrandtii]MDQ0427215.1 putative membrane protein YqjE [Planomicrobium stackebrandtii]
MNAIQLTSMFLVDFKFSSLVHNHNLILIVGIVVLFISVLLRSVKTLSLQSILLFLLFASQEVFSNPLYILLIVLQLALGFWVMWKVKEAIDETYYRHSEKTLKRTRDITRGGNPGTHHFLL